MAVYQWREWVYNKKRINGVDFYDVLRCFDQVVWELNGKENVLVVDLGAVKEWSDDDFYDLIHMAPAGAARVGSLIYAELLDKLKF